MGSLFSLLPVLLVVCYYGIEWYRAKRHSPEAVMVQYEPPRGLSPALMRYIWKERFDDRTFWACLLSLVSKNCVVLMNKEGGTYATQTSAHHPNDLAPEEFQLLRSLFSGNEKRSVRIDDPEASIAMFLLARKLRSIAVGRWFYQNRSVVIAGTILSMTAVCIAASPRSVEEWGALLLGMFVMVPAGYYLFFVVLRIGDLRRAVRGGISAGLAYRVAFLAFIVASCVASFVLGALVLTDTFSWIVTVTIGVLALVNVRALVWLRLPTVEGRRLLREIEGFRDFLQSVESLPMDQKEAPSKQIGLYEEYLPYALALEVEQRWADSQLAIASCFQEEPQLGTRPFYLGTWDGKPVEVVYRAQRNSRW